MNYRAGFRYMFARLTRGGKYREAFGARRIVIPPANSGLATVYNIATTKKWDNSTNCPTEEFDCAALSGGLQLLRERRIAQLFKRFAFDLAYAFSRDAEIITDLF